MNIISNFNDVDLPTEKQGMKTGKAKGWLGEYHWVSLPQEPDQPPVTEQAIVWCNSNLGKPGSRWFEKKDKFYFKNEQDMTMFILKWA